MLNEQYVILRTKEGTASDDNDLERVWTERLKKIGSHYEVVVAQITKYRTD